ncbi:unnamed protein product [Ectocarpus sp. 8 AP-2014]
MDWTRQRCTSCGQGLWFTNSGMRLHGFAPASIDSWAAAQSQPHSSINVRTGFDVRTHGYCFLTMLVLLMLRKILMLSSPVRHDNPRPLVVRYLPHVTDCCSTQGFT